MKKIYSKIEEDQAQIDLTPLMDIVFIMLIFFIVTTSFVKESGVEIQRPQAASAEKMKPNSLLIALTAEGQIWIEGQAVDLRAVSLEVERLKAQNPEASVVIQADKESKNGLLVQVIDQVRLAGIDQIAIAATQP